MAFLIVMFLPDTIRNRLEKNKWYLRLRYATPVLKIWLLLRQDTRQELEKQKALYQSILQTSDSQLVFDVGAHEGFVTQLLTELGYKVLAIEPSQRNVAILQVRFRNNPDTTVLPVALSSQSGTHHFFESSTGFAFGTLSRKWKAIREETVPNKKAYRKPVTIVTTTLDTLIAQYGVPAFIKIDVEGYEENVLRGLTQKVPLLSFEAILPHFLTETINCINYLDSLAADVLFNYAVGHKLVHATFLPKDRLVDEVNAVKDQTIEIFCRMK